MYPSLRGGSQDKAIKIQGDITLPSPSVLCLFLGEKTEVGIIIIIIIFSLSIYIPSCYLPKVTHTFHHLVPRLP